MTTTVAIPPEIVGDTETLRGRRADAEAGIVSWARVLVNVPNYDGSTRYCMGHLTDEVERYEHLSGEIRRRLASERMAHAIQPEETWWR